MARSTAVMDAGCSVSASTSEYGACADTASKRAVRKCGSLRAARSTGEKSPKRDISIDNVRMPCP